MCFVSVTSLKLHKYRIFTFRLDILATALTLPSYCNTGRSRCTTLEMAESEKENSLITWKTLLSTYLSLLLQTGRGLCEGTSILNKSSKRSILFLNFRNRNTMEFLPFGYAIGRHVDSRGDFIGK